jgi:hypothetical protein
MGVHTMSHEHSHHDQSAAPAELNDRAKLAVLLPHLLKHNEEHSREIAQWAGKADPEVARELETVVELSTQISAHMRLAIEKLKTKSL